MSASDGALTGYDGVTPYTELETGVDYDIGAQGG